MIWFFRVASVLVFIVLFFALKKVLHEKKDQSDLDL